MFRLPRHLLEKFFISVILGKPDIRHFKAFCYLLWMEIKFILYTGYTVEEIQNKNRE